MRWEGSYRKKAAGGGNRGTESGWERGARSIPASVARRSECSPLSLRDDISRERERG